MRLLALDTAQKACSVAAWEEGRVTAHRFEVLGTGHAEALFAMIGEVAAEALLPLNEVERYAVTIGPGTFTGLRVGLSAVRGMALAAKVPAVGVTTLEAIAGAAALSGSDRPLQGIVASFDARRREAYWQVFSGFDAPSTPPRLSTIPDIVTSLRQMGVAEGVWGFVGTGADLLAAALAEAGIAPEIQRFEGLDYPDARIVAQIAAGADPADRPAQPLYLRAPDAKVSEKRLVFGR